MGTAMPYRGRTRVCRAAERTRKAKGIFKHQMSPKLRTLLQVVDQNLLPNRRVGPGDRNGRGHEQHKPDKVRRAGACSP